LGISVITSSRPQALEARLWREAPRLFRRGARIVDAVLSLSRARRARRTCARPLLRSSRCAARMRQRD